MPPAFTVYFYKFARLGSYRDLGAAITSRYPALSKPLGGLQCLGRSWLGGQGTGARWGHPEGAGRIPLERKTWRESVVREGRASPRSEDPRSGGRKGRQPAGGTTRNRRFNKNAHNSLAAATGRNFSTATPHTPPRRSGSSRPLPPRRLRPLAPWTTLPLAPSRAGLRRGLRACREPEGLEPGTS